MSQIESSTYCNYLTLWNSVKVLSICFVGISCANLSKPKDLIMPLKGPEAVYTLELKPLVGRQEVTKYYSHSHIKSFESDQISRARDEIVEFDVEVKTIREDKSKGFIHTITKTIEKDGVVDLHELAFPEINERIELVYKKNAEVVYASGYPATSVFYLPPISLPEESVKKGDTWELQKSWISRKNSIPLSLNLVSILKNIYPCAQGQCADIEVSGEVGIIASLDSTSDFKSELRGRILFAIDIGTPIWSLLISKESIRMGDNVVEVDSCLLSTLKEPKKERWPFSEKDSCNPKEESIITIPGTKEIEVNL